VQTAAFLVQAWSIRGALFKWGGRSRAGRGRLLSPPGFTLCLMCTEDMESRVEGTLQ
jgi:hypothetical protein